MAAKFEFKNFFLSHVEKMVFGIVALVAVVGLAQTDWSPYAGTTADIYDKIDKGEKNLAAQVWPDADKVKYAVQGDKIPQEIADTELFKPLDIAQFQFSNKFLRVLGANRDPVTEPVLIAPQDIIVTGSRVFIELPMLPPGSESKEGEDPALAKAEEKKEEEVDDEFLVRNSGGMAGAAGMPGMAGGGYESEFYAPFLDGGYEGGGYGMPGGAGAAGAYGMPGGAGAAGAYGMPGGAGAGYGSAGYGGAGYGAAGYGGAAGMPLGGDAGAGLGFPGGAYEGGGYGGMMAPAIKLNGQGYHYASVRAIFPLRDQIMKYADAIHRPYSEAARTFQIIDFVLQRQAKQPGDDPWTGPWEQVDIKYAQDVLEKCAYQEPDVINSMITDSVITMPLPSRITGRWKKDATHPRIEKFELSEQEIVLEMELNSKLLKQFQDQDKKETEGLLRKGGFSNQLYDPKAIQNQMMGGSSMYSGFGMGMGYEDGGMGMMGEAGMGAGAGAYGMGGGGYGAAGTAGGGGYGAGRMARPPGMKETPAEKLMKLIAEELKNEKLPPDKQKAKEEALREWITKRVSASGELLLFRYIDFSVEPGKTYRYRVKLVLNNPNYNRRIAEAGGVAHVVEGPTRETDWSDISAPVQIRDSLQYYVSNVVQRATQMIPFVSMDMYQWDATLGTYMHDTLDVSPGQKIGGDDVTEVIRPAEQKMEAEKYTFTSSDYLVDAIGDLEIDQSFHYGDKVDAAVRLKLPGAGRKVGVPGIALIDGGDDGLRMFDGFSHAEELAKDKQKMENQAKAFESLKNMLTGGPAGAFGDMAGLGGYEAMMTAGYEGMMMGGMGTNRGRNSNQKKAKARRNERGVLIRGGGGMPGGGMPGIGTGFPTN